MKQTKLVSLIEAVVNTTIGLFISVTGNVVAFWVLGIEATVSQYTFLVVFMTALSVIRGYGVRRLFNSEFWKKEVKYIGEATHTS